MKLDIVLLQGIDLQWGQAYGYKNSKITTLPIAFPNQKLCEVVGVTYSSSFYEAPACIKRNDGSLTTITTGVYSGPSSTDTPVRYIILGIQQWGQKASSGSTTSVTYPIAMSSCFTVIGNMCTNGINGYEHNVYPYTISTSTFTMYTRNTDSKAFSWLAVGKQQWGSLYIPKEQKLQFVYPLTFTSTAFAIALSNEGTSNTAYASAFSNLTNSSVYLADNAATVHCIIVGVQQWGFKHMSASGTHSNTTITYPIAFGTQCYSVASTREGTSADGTWNAVISNLTTTTFLCQLKIGLYWFAVGKQQWGEGSYTTYTFPITFTNTLYVFVSQMNINFANSHYERNNYVYTKTNSKITLGTDNINRFWTAIGY